MKQVKYTMLVAAALIVSAGIIENNALISLALLCIAGIGVIKGRLWRMEE